MKKLAFLLLLALPLLAQAAVSETLSRSAGKLLADDSVSLQQKLAQSPLVHQRLDDSSRRQARTAQHFDSVNFYFFDASVELSGDDDNDGYFHRITTYFDADVDSAQETAYAKIFLSYQGGPWRQVADTDLFEISYDSMGDSYVVETDLVEGYRSGDYDVLIELYSLFHSGMVASVELFQDSEGYVISLEDSERDRPPVSVATVTTSYSTDTGYLVTEEEYVAGSLSWPGLILLAMLVAIKWRYFPTQSDTTWLKTISR